MGKTLILILAATLGCGACARTPSDTGCILYERAATRVALSPDHPEKQRVAGYGTLHLLDARPGVVRVRVNGGKILRAPARTGAVFGRASRGERGYLGVTLGQLGDDPRALATYRDPAYDSGFSLESIDPRSGAVVLLARRQPAR